MNEIEEERQELLKKATDNFNDEEELKRRFGDGTVGAHELADRTFMIMEMWEGYVKDHPTTLMDPKAFELASEIVDKMYKMYNLAANHSLKDSSLDFEKPK